MDSLLLCTDLDRTLLPNGGAVESAAARERFCRVARQPELVLAYVTGRHLESLQHAIEEYELPHPDFAICDVGSSIYAVEGVDDERASSSSLSLLETWRAQLRESWDVDSVTTLRTALADMGELRLQEPERQGPFKLSYYVPALEAAVELREQVETRLRDREVDVHLVYSVDETRDIGLLDLLPSGSGKKAAIEHLISSQNLDRERTLFAGDSGNDLEVLSSSIPAVLVANASEEVRTRALQRAAEFRNEDRLHLARGGILGMNGNYSAGILEGLIHYWPETEAWLS